VLNQTALSQSVQDANAGDVVLGSSSNSRLQNFSLDEFGIWNRTLTATDILELFNGGQGISLNQTLVTINEPANNQKKIINNNVTFEADILSYSLDLINTSIFLRGVLNETHTISGLTNTHKFFKTFDSVEELNWSIQACTTDGDCTITLNRTLNITTFAEINSTFNSTLLITQRGSYITQIGTFNDTFTSPVFFWSNNKFN
ncbi:hypothetical protein LCGC14_2186750, partial [marine sediment metagenome]